MKGLVGLFLVLVLMSCAASKKSEELNKTSWEMTRLEMNGLMKNIPSDKPIVLFEDNNVLNGTTGCNSFFGKYDISKDGSMELQIEGITKAFCMDSQEVEDILLNQKMIQNLTFSVDGDILVLENVEQKLRIEFIRK